MVNGSRIIGEMIATYARFVPKKRNDLPMVVTLIEELATYFGR